MIRSVLYKVIAIFSLLIVGILIGYYPAGVILPVIALLSYMAVLYVYPHAWLIVLPALLPVLDFGMWTGNVVYTEFDWFFFASMAVLFWRKSPDSYLYRLNGFYDLFLLLFLLSILLGFRSYFYGNQSDDVYQSYLNSLRVGKGFISAWLFWYLFRELLIKERAQALKHLAIGFLVGIFAFALSILWERHVISALLFDRNLYSVLNTLLDFAGTYRVTGLFNGMRVGGTAIDGYIICSLPILLYLISRPLKPIFWMLALLVFTLGIYCLIVTFTRMTIASFFAALLVSMLLMVFHKQRDQIWRNIDNKDRYILLAASAVAIGGMVICYQLTGYQGLLVSVVVWFIALFGAYFKEKLNVNWMWAGLALLLIGGAYGIYDSVIDSKWHQDTPAIRAFAQAVFFSTLWGGLGYWIGNYCQISAIDLQHLRMPLVIGGGLVFLLVGINSTRMSERFSEAGKDIDIRQNHWYRVMDTRTPDSWRALLFGEGMGTMPKLYYLNYFSEDTLPSFRWQQADGKASVQLGVGGFPFHQKIPLKPNTQYKLLFKFKAELPNDKIGIDICHKHILFSEHWQPDCIETQTVAKTTEWTQLEWSFNSGHLGQYGWLDWSPTLQIHNYAENPLIVDSVEIFDPQGQQIIKNPQFDERLAYWLWTSDFEHLPWHSKQIFIHVWLEQGWLGLIMFVLLMVLGFLRQIKLYSLGETMPIALIPSMVAILGLGLTDTFIDEPQISFLTFSILFAALQWPNDLSTTARLNRDSRIVFE